MSKSNNENWRPELLAGYADGELSPSQRDDVEKRLGINAADRAELKSQNQLSKRNARFWQAVAITPPDERQWAEVMNKVHSGLTTPVSMPAQKAASWYRWAIPAVAAAVVAAVVVLPVYQPFPPVTEVAAGIGLPVCKAAEVDIISIHEADVGLLCVGEAPQRGALELATTGDLTYFQIVGDFPGSKPLTDPSPGSNKPLLWTPVQTTQPVP